MATCPRHPGDLEPSQRMRAHFPDGALRRHHRSRQPAGADGQRRRLRDLPNPADIGGRFSATSLFGLVQRRHRSRSNVALDAAEQMLEDPADRRAPQPRRKAAAFLFAAHESQRWFLRPASAVTLRASPLGWSSRRGEHRRVARAVAHPGEHGSDRSPEPAAVAVVGTSTFVAPTTPWPRPVKTAASRYDVVMPAKTDLWAEVVRWEVATALVGALLEQNPFDEPDVSAAKAAAQQILSGQSAPRPADRELVVPSVKALTKALEPELAEAGADEALAVLAYLPPTESNLHRLSALRDRLQQNTAATVTVSVGPRYLHSTGQLHKGGRPACRFVLLHDHDQLEACSASPDLAEIIRAQALGDVMVLKDRGRHVSLARLGGN